MNTFKVGDKVVVIDDKGNGKYKNGSILKVLFVHPGDYYRVGEDDNNFIGLHGKESLHLVKKSIRDVEVGDIIISKSTEQNEYHSQKVLGLVGLLVFISYGKCAIGDNKGHENYYKIVTLEELEKSWNIFNIDQTITIDGKTYNKEEVEKRLAELKPVE